ncbi:MAG TPA: sigma-70 family RNA polymerase sigma factor [Nocardioides sp.]|uniref:RNA polymerase sigma factor n=1 Tax=Nocardioides sp. TaxID=35761 RepID=UPI002F42C775
MAGGRVEDLLRELAPQVLAVLTRRYGDFAAAEDAVQEALLAGHQHWADGPPEHPFGWLVQTASRRFLDQRRSEASRRDREQRFQREQPPAYDVVDRDDSLALLFLACHPALTPASAIALTLRAVGGLTTAEIARAFLVPEPTMAQRISRAKQTIRAAGARFEPLTPAEQTERLPVVLHVLYLVFNEGYAATSGDDLNRVELSAEAIRLTRMLHRSLSDEPEVKALLSLMLLLDARLPARTDDAGNLVTLAEQDRGRWDRDLIAEGLRLLDEAMGTGRVGEYRIQAAIAAVHDGADRAEDTDWPQIHALYGLLEVLTDNPVVTLNRAVALAMVDGPLAGLALVDSVADRLPDHPRLLVVRAHLLEQSGDGEAARRLFRRAADLATSRPERERLLMLAARHPS